MTIKKGKIYILNNKTIYVPDGNDISLILSPTEIFISEKQDFFRLIADEGKKLKKDDIITTCTDTETIEGWIEIDDDSVIQDSASPTEEKIKI